MSASITIVDGISIVDDDKSTRESLSGLLRSAGFAVNVFASSGAFLGSDQFACTDCLILDVRMPGIVREVVAGNGQIDRAQDRSVPVFVRPPDTAPVPSTRSTIQSADETRLQAATCH